MNMLYPWQTQQFARLVQLHKQDRMPHALLLNGANGIGKSNLAEILAQSLLCESPQAEGQPCNHCHGCSLFNADTHPDVHHLGPEEKSKVIRIDQIRQFIEKLGLSSHYGRYKVVIINPADVMNTAAANSLLKTLEEPSDNTLIILLTDKLAKLPATIRSRCQVMNIELPPHAVSLKWLTEYNSTDFDPAVLLSLSHGRPLAARALLDDERLAERESMLKTWQALANGQEDPIKVATNWSKPEIGLPLTWIYGWLGDMIRLKTAPGSQRESQLGNPDAKATLHNLANGLDLVKMFELLTRVEEAIKLHDTQVNDQTILEGILLHWSNLPRTKA